MGFPRMMRVRQKFDAPKIADVPAEVEKGEDVSASHADHENRVRLAHEGLEYGDRLLPASVPEVFRPVFAPE